MHKIIELTKKEKKMVSGGNLNNTDTSSCHKECATVCDGEHLVFSYHTSPSKFETIKGVALCAGIFVVTGVVGFLCGKARRHFHSS